MPAYVSIRQHMLLGPVENVRTMDILEAPQDLIYECLYMHVRELLRRTDNLRKVRRVEIRDDKHCREFVVVLGRWQRPLRQYLHFCTSTARKLSTENLGNRDHVDVV